MSPAWGSSSRASDAAAPCLPSRPRTAHPRTAGAGPPARSPRRQPLRGSAETADDQNHDRCGPERCPRRFQLRCALAVPQMFMTAYLASMLVELEVRFLIVIQYVIVVAVARSTATSHSICGAPMTGVVETTVHTTSQLAGQLNVNHRRELFPETDPVN